MSLLDLLYYGFSIILWLGLTTMVILVFRPGFVPWLEKNPRIMFYLLGIEKLPEKGTKILKRFYCFLCGGWTWIIIWSWWIMPRIKEYFFQAIANELSFKVTRISLMIIVAGYAAVGFFGIGKAITIWFKELYTPLVLKQLSKK